MPTQLLVQAAEEVGQPNAEHLLPGTLPEHPAQGEARFGTDARLRQVPVPFGVQCVAAHDPRQEGPDRVERHAVRSADEVVEALGRIAVEDPDVGLPDGLVEQEIYGVAPLVVAGELSRPGNEGQSQPLVVQHRLHDLVDLAVADPPGYRVERESTVAESDRLDERTRKSRSCCPVVVVGLVDVEPQPSAGALCIEMRRQHAGPGSGDLLFHQGGPKHVRTDLVPIANDRHLHPGCDIDGSSRTDVVRLVTLPGQPGGEIREGGLDQLRLVMGLKDGSEAEQCLSLLLA